MRCVRVIACAAVCYNCATLDSNTCRCSCEDGWQSADCSGIILLQNSP